jgi:primosomal protein N' (replication factor Y)
VLQAYNIEDYAVETAICQDYQAFYTREIAIRQQLGNPPFSHIGLVMVSAGDGNDSLRAIEKLYQYIFKTYGTDAGIVITKPMKAPIYILRNKARWRLIIKHLSVNRLFRSFGMF